MASQPKRVCFFGTYDREYERTRVLRQGFIENGFEVIECHIDPRTNRGMRKFFSLVRLARPLRRQRLDHVIVGFPGHSVVWLARMLFGKRIIFDALVSLYDSNAFDRKVYAPTSWRGRRDYFYDWLGARLSHLVLLDTLDHCRYFHETFGQPLAKFVRVFLSADPQMFAPQEVRLPSRPTIVQFHGTFIPNHGMPAIIEAARLLKDEPILFRLIGGGQELAAAHKQAEGLGNIEFIPRAPLEAIRDYMAQAHMVLGSFGDTEKAARVIPNKVYEAFAMAKPVITRNSLAVRELIKPDIHALLVPPADPQALAEATLRLAQDRALQERLSQSARALFEEQLMPQTIVRQLLRDIEASYGARQAL